jgi:RimJ/RimL family protein N-acetyltransferase
MDLISISLFSPRLRLKPFEPADAGEVWGASTFTLTRFMNWEPAPSLDAFAQIWRQWKPMLIKGTGIHFTARLQVTDEFIGMVALHDLTASEPEVGIWIKESRHGLGFGSEAVAAVAGLANQLGKAAVIYPVVEMNAASRRLAEKLGGVVVGTRTLRKAGGNELAEVVYRIPTASQSDQASTGQKQGWPE